jgi:hypothetical protein
MGLRWPPMRTQQIRLQIRAGRRLLERRPDQPAPVRERGARPVPALRRELSAGLPTSAHPGRGWLALAPVTSTAHTGDWP